MLNENQTQADIMMAAAVAAQNEATASRAVADSVKQESLANPQDKDLAASAVAKEAEAVKDQAAADKALSDAMAAETQNEVLEQIAEPIKAAEPIQVSTPVVKEEPKVVQKVAAPVASGTIVNTSKASLATGSFADKVSKIKAEGTVFERSMIAQLEQYMSAMKPGTPIDANTGARYQTNLWRIIQNVIERSGDEFKPCYNLLLSYFEEYKNDVFHERYVFRFTESISLPAEELATYQQMVNLLKLTCSPKGRAQSLRQVDLGRTMKNNISEPARQKVLEFYNA